MKRVALEWASIHPSKCYLHSTKLQCTGRKGGKSHWSTPNEETFYDEMTNESSSGEIIVSETHTSWHVNWSFVNGQTIWTPFLTSAREATLVATSLSSQDFLPILEQCAKLGYWLEEEKNKASTHICTRGRLGPEIVCSGFLPAVTPTSFKY